MLKNKKMFKNDFSQLNTRYLLYTNRKIATRVPNLISRVSFCGPQSMFLLEKNKNKEKKLNVLYLDLSVEKKN